MENDKVYLGFYSYNDKVEILKEFSSIDYANIYTGNFKASEELALNFNLWPQTRFCLLGRKFDGLFILSNDIAFSDSDLLKHSYINLIVNYDENYNRDDVIYWLNNRTILELKKILNICESNLKHNESKRNSF